MSDFTDSIKISEKDKKDAMKSIVLEVLIRPGVLELEEVLKLATDVKNKLNEDEILATYQLAKQIKTKKRPEVLEYINLRNGYEIDEDKLLTFIKKAVEDKRIGEKRFPHAKGEWKLSTRKILDRLNGKPDPYDEELAKDPSLLNPSAIVYNFPEGKEISKE